MITLEMGIKAGELIIVVAVTSYFLYRFAFLFQPDGTGFFGLRRDR